MVRYLRRKVNYRLLISITLSIEKEKNVPKIDRFNSFIF